MTTRLLPLRVTPAASLPLVSVSPSMLRLSWVSGSWALASRSIWKPLASSLVGLTMAVTSGASLTPSMVMVAEVSTRPPLPSLIW
ncbi:hypothetical protein D3C80_1236890 [compost metagenome]